MQDNYSASIKWLFERFPSYQNVGANAYKPGLQSIENVLNFLDNPHLSLNFIHVAGTNGKGSTCSMLAALFQEKGYKVGLFTSPHLLDFRERIRVNGKGIDKNEVQSFCKIISDQNWAIEPSFFEITLGMALEHFRNNQCDMVILETGMGGRLDATNIVTPILSVITRIGYDHQQFLGDTLEKIAMEKAGIIKPHIPLVVAEPNPDIKNIFKEVANSMDSAYFEIEENHELKAANIPNYQKRNLITAAKVFEVLNLDINEESLLNAWKNLFESTGFIGRLFASKEHIDLLYDVSHNEDGINETMKENIFQKNQKIHLIFGASGDKHLGSLPSFFPANTQWYFTEFSNERTKKIKELQSLAESWDLQSPYFVKNVNIAIEKALQTRKENELILVMGSFFLLSDCFEIQNMVNHQLNQ